MLNYSVLLLRNLNSLETYKYYIFFFKPSRDVSLFFYRGFFLYNLLTETRGSSPISKHPADLVQIRHEQSEKKHTYILTIESET